MCFVKLLILIQLVLILIQNIITKTFGFSMYRYKKFEVFIKKKNCLYLIDELTFIIIKNRYLKTINLFIVTR